MSRFIPPWLAKALVIGLLIVLLLIPLAQLHDLVDERVAMRQEAATRVAASSGGAQTTAGVLLAIPIDITPIDTTAIETNQRRWLYVLPDRLNVKASVDPGYRTVGLYRTPVYQAQVAVSGAFLARDFATAVAQSGGEAKWQEARFLILNSEARSLRAVDGLRIGSESPAISADGYAGLAGASALLPAAAQNSEVIEFGFSLTLAGSERLMFLPLARKAQIEVSSPWQHPKFEGAPAPLDPRIGESGFQARWSVLEINRNFGQSWFDDRVREAMPADSAFAQSAIGVSFYEPVDVYQRNYRAVHYAALLISITFLTFFLWEHVSGIAIHPMQYLVVGAALALFYLLLLALSEHLSFDLAYGLSSGALVGLIAVYLSGVLRSFRRAAGAAAGLAGLYALLYWILRSEDYSLLMGALLLLGVLAVLMVTTRHVDWSSFGRRETP